MPPRITADAQQRRQALALVLLVFSGVALILLGVASHTLSPALFGVLLLMTAGVLAWMLRAQGTPWARLLA